jgi:replicative DNA helicase
MPSTTSQAQTRPANIRQLNLSPEAVLSSPEAEKRVIGAMLAQPEVFVQTHGLIAGEEDFTVPECRAAFRGIKTLSGDGAEFDYRAIALHIYHFDDQARMALLNGAQYPTEADALAQIEGRFVELMRHGMYDQKSLEQNISVINDMAARRGMVELGNAIISSARDMNTSRTKSISVYSDKVIALQQRNQSLQLTTSEEGADMIEANAHAAMNGKLAVENVTTGFAAVDRTLGGGFIPGTMNVYAAVTGHGKTTAILHEILVFGKQGGVIVLGSTEYDTKRVYEELMSMEAGVPTKAIRDGTLLRNDSARFFHALRTVRAIKLMVVHATDDDGVSFSRLHNAVQLMKIKHGHVDLMIVDWLQDMGVPSDVKASIRNSDKAVTAKLTWIIPKIKNMAKYHNIPVLVTAQMSRESEDKKKLEPSFITGTIEIWRNAEVVIMFGRAEKYVKNLVGTDRWLVKVGKKREGSGGYFMSDEFRIDPVSRQVQTRLHEPVHPDQYRNILEIEAPTAPAPITEPIPIQEDDEQITDIPF